MFSFVVARTDAAGLGDEDQAPSVKHLEEPVIEFDIDKPPKTRHRLTPSVTFGSSVSLSFDLEKNYDLDSDLDDDLSKLEPEWEVAFSFDPTPLIRGFLSLELSKDFLLKHPDDTSRPTTELKVDKAARAMAFGFARHLGRTLLAAIPVPFMKYPG